jgi:hypothetical protein
MAWQQFEEVSLKGSRKGKCALCGKQTCRVFKIYQTINPFNKNARGLIKTRDEILVELHLRRQAKLAEPLYCKTCELSPEALHRAGGRPC